MPAFLKVSCAAPMKPDSALSHITPRHPLDAATGFSDSENRLACARFCRLGWESNTQTSVKTGLFPEVSTNSPQFLAPFFEPDTHPPSIAKRTRKSKSEKMRPSVTYVLGLTRTGKKAYLTPMLRRRLLVRTEAVCALTCWWQMTQL